MRETFRLLVEFEIYVDEHGYAHSDEMGEPVFVGTSWAGKTFGGGRIPSALSKALSKAHRETEYLRIADYYEKKGMLKALERALEKDRNNKFLKDILGRMRWGTKMTRKQLDAVGKILRRLGMDVEANLFDKKGQTSKDTREKGDEEMVKVLDVALAKRSNYFLDSIRSQLQRGKALTDKQKKAVRKNLYQLGMRQEAGVFKESVVVRFGEQQATTTGGIQARSTKPIYLPHPFWPILPKVSTVPAGEVKAQAACMKAMRAYSMGKIDKKALDRICGGMK